MKFNSKKAIKAFDSRRKTIFWSLASLLLLFVSLYVYLINTTALNAVNWKKADKDISLLSASISEQESKYFSLQQGITLAKAYENGFEDVKNIKFINTPKVGRAADTNEI